ncbi:hypothetical protein ACIGXM_11180 [Kitasatospora sp. NPDC052896]|uniref:hypothetical protein n=1 Tax=Kitasatospora sp. NPDC052896 TaxID=3364061 RepID=UPI0037C59DEE
MSPGHLVPDDAEHRQALDHRTEAEAAAAAFEHAQQLALLPPLVGLELRRITSTREGAHIEIGGCSARTLRAYAEHIEAHAHCAGHIIQGEVVPPREAEPPVARAELTK